jgi:hypothetical protein
MADTIDLDEFARRIREAAGGKLPDAIRAELAVVALEAEGRAATNATTRPRVRSGNLRRNIAGIVRPMGADGLDLVLTNDGRLGGGAPPYASLQHDGGTIVPKRAKWLAIPAEANKTKAGDSRGGPRTMGDLSFQPTKRADLAMLVRRARGKGSSKMRPEVMFWLRKRVSIPATRYLAKAWEAVPGEVEKALGDAIDRAVRV